MAYVKKITADQFMRDVIDFELKQYGIDFEYVNNLPKKPKNPEEVDPNVEYQDGWYSRYKFHNFEEFNAFRQYIYEHFKDYAAQRYWTKDILYREFEYFNLQFGLATDYDFDEHLYKKNADDMFKKVYGKKNK
jgi:hypothetical protein